MQMIQTEVSKAVTMSSLELVDFINSQRSPDEAELQHKHFLDKVPLVLGEGYAEFSATYQHPQNKQIYPMFRFPKREACLMAMSYSYDLQAKVFDRMTELEAQRAPAALIGPWQALTRPELPSPPKMFQDLFLAALSLNEEKDSAARRANEAVLKKTGVNVLDMLGLEKKAKTLQPLGDNGVMVLGDVCFVPLEKGFRAIVDREDLDEVLKKVWKVSHPKLVCKVYRDAPEFGKQTKETLQDFIFRKHKDRNFRCGMKAAHKNYNALDNRRGNLELSLPPIIKARNFTFIEDVVVKAFNERVKSDQLETSEVLLDIYTKLEQELISSL